MFAIVALLLACSVPATPVPPAPPAPSGPQVALAVLDTRRPVPLQPMMAWHQKRNMMGHLEAVQAITDAAAREDWVGVQKAASRIESSPEMKMQCEHMGAGAEGFTELALSFHEQADTIGVAARAEDGTAVLAATARTLEVCTRCHARYRQDVVDEATWQERTGSTHTMGGSGH